MGDTQGRRWRLGTLGAVVVAALLVACGSSPGGGEKLQENAFQPTQVTKLPGGGRVAVGSPDGHRVVVQWQSDASIGWTAPETVYSEADQFTHEINVVVAGDTVALNPDFWTEEELDDDYDPDHTVQVLCSDRDCGDGRTSSYLTSTELDASGDFAAFGLGDGTVLLWSEGAYREATFSGVPDGDHPEMFADGSFGLVAAEPHGQLCRYRLLASTPRSTALRSQVVSRDYPASQPCDTASTDLSEDKASVSVESLEDSVDFVRTDGRWAVDEPTSPLEAYPDTQGKSSLKNDLANRSDESTVSIGSPDMKRVFAQFRAAGSKEWSEPVQVARAPRGTLCRFQSVDRDDLAVTDVISCFDTRKPFQLGETDPTAGIALATDDGRTWAVKTLVRPDAEVQRGAGQDKLFVGSTRSYAWSPSAGMRTIDLRVDTRRDTIVSTPDGKVIRVSGNPSGGAACKPSYQVADLGATSWPAARPVPDLTPTSADDRGCVGTAFPDGDGGFQVEFWYAWLGSIEQRGDDWVAVKAAESS